jgi:hypothetical protein
MAIIPKQIGWSQESNLIWEVLRQLDQLTKVTSTSGGGDARPYKVYSALLTQSGDDNNQLLTSGTLTIGVTYTINLHNGSDDFTNVGAPNNNDGTSFVATGTTPNVWTSGSEIGYNEATPTVIVLENTLGDVWYGYEDTGSYFFTSDNLFTTGKTFAFVGGPILTTVNLGICKISTLNVTQGTIGSYDVQGGLFNGQLLNTAFEIRVYN